MDLQGFLNASLTPRTRTLDVPALADFFGDKPAQWTVRGLTAAEVGRANLAAAKRAEAIKTLVEALAGEGDKAEALKSAMGISDEEVPEDVSRRIEMLTTGSVDPAIGPENRDVAVKLAENYPTVFFELTNHILVLTGEGSELGKPKRSGKARA